MRSLIDGGRAYPRERPAPRGRQADGSPALVAIVGVGGRGPVAWYQGDSYLAASVRMALVTEQTTEEDLLRNPSHTEAQVNRCCDCLNLGRRKSATVLGTPTARRTCAALHTRRPQPRCWCCRPEQAATADRDNGPGTPGLATCLADFCHGAESGCAASRPLAQTAPDESPRPSTTPGGENPAQGGNALCPWQELDLRLRCPLTGIDRCGGGPRPCKTAALEAG